MPKSKSRFHPPLAMPNRCSDVPDTNSEHTAQLWEVVMTSRASRKKEQMLKVQNTASIPESCLPSDADQTLEAGTTKNESSKLTLAEVSDPDFEQTILKAHGIEIIREMHPSKRHLLARVTKESDKTWESLSKLSMWQRRQSSKLIADEHNFMSAHSCNESLYKLYALSSIFLAEPQNLSLLDEPRWVPALLVEFVSQPPKPTLKIPLLLHEANKRYEWDIRPDAAYWVSLQAFQDYDCENVRLDVFTAEERAICPYLTIEFKKNSQPKKVAENQIAVASALALYNRYLLKCEALAKTSRSGEISWSKEDEDALRHYCITFSASEWELWCTVPNSFSSWTGCNVYLLKTGRCVREAGVERLFEVLDGIHYWGMKTHGPSCKADILRVQGVEDELEEGMEELNCGSDD
ncbi:hypothetical protein F4680DRAFT_466261 [Xylaria scruposa]|nr:hypothetical protein F4680DRAFT_466261 [Xylaria scruposa]